MLSFSENVGSACCNYIKVNIINAGLSGGLFFTSISSIGAFLHLQLSTS